MKYVLVFSLLFSSVLFFGFSSSAPADPEGKTIFVNSKCGTCHSVESEGITAKAKKNVDLSETGIKNSKENLQKFLLKQEKLNNKNHPSAFKGTDEELSKLTEWLSSLKGKK